MQREHKKCTGSRTARNRLLSIRHDVESFCKPIVLATPRLRDLPIVPNERCGAWYAYPLMNDGSTSCYFKSTDGHYGTWNFSLKRLNLNIIRLLTIHQACIIMDASTTKILPDSFSRTIPIWAAVMNRIAIRYRRLYNISPCEHDHLDGCTSLFTPDDVVAQDERDIILQMIDERVETLYQSQAIVNPLWLASVLLKPLRPIWLTPQSAAATSILPLLDDVMFHNYYVIICINCSDYKAAKSTIEASGNENNEAFRYLPGAADDHESWARHLTPQLFWNNVRTILSSEHSMPSSFDNVLVSIAQQEICTNEEFEKNILATEQEECHFDPIEQLNIFVGTRRAGRPPLCWNHFDAILNVTDVEYVTMNESIKERCRNACASDESLNHPTKCFYLQLPVREGKRDRTELENWLALGIAFIILHAREKRRVLIHCAQGMDRSIAVVIAVVAIFCENKYPLQWNDCFYDFPLEELLQSNTEDTQYGLSGLSSKAAKLMLGREGKHALFALTWANRENENVHITKASIRITLQLIQQYREKANPARSTMQKLHRFLLTNDVLCRSQDRQD
jgi:tRNA A64-2'-O-ribosylphosphate transferase